MELFKIKLIMATGAVLLIALPMMADRIRGKKKYTLVISITMGSHSSVIIQKNYSRKWIAVIAAWWHTTNLQNMKPFLLETKIDQING